ncbi:hypothetical protein E4U61_001160 [Claviceps capensis]|nr:hypothetical protein E4U61_001160 [Claviceps capensis]
MGLPFHSEVSRRDVDAGQTLIVGGTLASDRVEANQVPRLKFPGADVVDVLDGHASKFSSDGTDEEGEMLTE